MTMSRLRAVVLPWAAASLLLAACTQPPTIAPKPKPTPAEIAAQQAADAAAMAKVAQDARVAAAMRTAESAYLHGYPLIISEVVRRQMSGADKAEGRRVPSNSFRHERKPGDDALFGDDGGVLASAAWLDLEQGALLFTHPAIRKRHVGFTLHSLWMTELGAWVGGDATRVLISGPGWQGQVPKGTQHVRSPTRYAILVGRVTVNGSAADERVVRSVQRSLRITLVDERGRPRKAAPPAADAGDGVAMNGTPRQVIASMDIADYFDLLARLLDGPAPPRPQDQALLQHMATLGIEPGKRFDFGALEPAVQAALADMGPRMQAKMSARRADLFTAVNGWQVPLPPGDADDLQRAAIAAFEWPGPVPQALMQLGNRVDAAGEALSGAHDYRLRFDKEGLPPVDGFWSITMVAEDEAGLPVRVPNTYDRSSLDMRDALLRNDDGSMTLYVQNLSPGYDRAANWLPAPKGEFGLTLRLYAPRAAVPSLLPAGGGTWAPPPLRRVD